MPTTIYLTNANVNGGSVIRIDAKSVNTKIECFTNVENTPKVSISDAEISTFYSKGRNTGFSNPVHTINGVIDLSASHATGSSAVLDYDYVLKLVKRSGTKCVLSSTKWATSTNATGAIVCMLKNYSDNNTNDNLLTFTMTFQEVNAS